MARDVCAIVDAGDRTTTLFAALNVLEGTVIARNMQRHRHQEFIRPGLSGNRQPLGRQQDGPRPQNMLELASARSRPVR